MSSLVERSVLGRVDLAGVSPPSDPGSPHAWRCLVLEAGPGYHKADLVAFRCARCGTDLTTFLDQTRSAGIAEWVQSVRRLPVLARCDDQLASKVMTE